MLQYKQAQNRSAKSLAEYKRLWTKYYLPYPIADQSIHNITYNIWFDHFSKLINSYKLNKNQCKQIVIVANNIYAYCIHSRLLTINPIWDMIVYGNLPYVNAPAYNEIKAPVFTEQQINNIIEWCNQRLMNPTVSKIYPLAIKFNFDVGLRFGELSALHWDDIDFEEGTITVSKQRVVECIMDDNGDFIYAGRKELDHLKAQENARILPLSTEARNILNSVKSLELEGDYVFPLRYNTYNSTVKKAAAYVTGEKKNSFRTHSVRTSAATKAYKKCHDVKTVQALLGHTTSEMTNKYIKSVDTFENLKKLMS